MKTSLGHKNGILLWRQLLPHIQGFMAGATPKEKEDFWVAIICSVNFELSRLMGLSAAKNMIAGMESALKTIETCDCLACQAHRREAAKNEPSPSISD